MANRPDTPLTRITTFLRRNGATVAIELLVNFLLPLLIYDLAAAPWGDVRALLASTVPPILWSLIEFIRRRRVDAVSMLVLAGIVLSLLAMVGGGGVRFLQLREKLVTGLIGIAFLGSAAIGRPLIYQLARASMERKSPSEAATFEKLQEHAGFRWTMTLMTLVWGVGLLADVALSVVLVYALSIRDYLIVNPILSYATMGGLALWTWWYGRRRKRLGDARRAEAERVAAGGEGRAGGS